jgi:hypothetical protein
MRTTPKKIHFENLCVGVGHRVWVVGFLIQGSKWRGVKLTNFCLMPSVVMSGAILLLPHTPSWLAQGQLHVYLYLIFTVLTAILCQLFPLHTPTHREILIFSTLYVGKFSSFGYFTRINRRKCVLY